MSAKLWFLHDIEDIMDQNKEKFTSGKNSWYNLLFMSAHIFVAGKYLEREAILQEMQAIYESEKPKVDAELNHIGFILPSKKKKDGKNEFGLINPDNVEKMRPIRAKNDKLNEELFIIQDFLMFLYGIDPRSQIFEEQYLSQLEELFEKWWEEQLKLRNEAFQKEQEEQKNQSPKANNETGNGEKS